MAMETVSLPIVQFLAWIAERPRTYRDVKQAWRSSCPRLASWEDALDGGLVRFETGGGARATDRTIVSLTERGRRLLRDAVTPSGA
jgi:hypothetical protein